MRRAAWAMAVVSLVSATSIGQPRRRAYLSEPEGAQIEAALRCSGPCTSPALRARARAMLERARVPSMEELQSAEGCGSTNAEAQRACANRWARAWRSWWSHSEQTLRALYWVIHNGDAEQRVRAIFQVGQLNSAAAAAITRRPFPPQRRTDPPQQRVGTGGVERYEQPWINSSTAAFTEAINFASQWRVAGDVLHDAERALEAIDRSRFPAPTELLPAPRATERYAVAAAPSPFAAGFVSDQ